MIYHSPGTLQWYESLEEQQRFKSYAQGQSSPIASGIARVPPFQLVIPLDYPDINIFKIVSVLDGTEYDRFSFMYYTGGFKTETYNTAMYGDGYKIVIWPGGGAIAGSPLPPVGRYYAVMGNGVHTFYSEEWEMLDDLSAYWKVEYCHGEEFGLPGGNGHIEYGGGYKNWFYFLTEVAKPEYFFDEKVSTRDGVNLPIQQIRWKTHKFQVIAPEEIADMISIIGLHDSVVVSRGNKTFYVDEFTMEANWMEAGNLAAVEVEFRTDTVIVINGRGSVSVDCAATGDCYSFIEGIPEVIDAVAEIVDGSTDWNNHQYTTPNGGTVALQEGDLVIQATHSDPELYTLYEYTAGTYVLQVVANGTYLYEANSGKYYYNNNGFPLAGSFVTNRIFTVSDVLVTGEAIPFSSVELWGLLATGTEVLLGLTDDATFIADGIDYSDPGGLIGVQLRVSTSICPNVYVSTWWYFAPLALIRCVGDYASDADALAGGAEPGDYYCLTLANVYGMPEAVVKKLEPFTGYYSDAGAIAVLGYDVVYQLATSNDLGMPGGTCRLAADQVTVYLDDADAAAGGVAVGEFYVYDPTGTGFYIGLIKQRKI